MILSDSKDRIMRVLFSTPNRGIVHIRIHFIYEPRVFARILAVISDTQFDIVRSQLRQGLFRPPDHLRPEDVGRYATLDLLIRTLLPDSEPLDTTLSTLIYKRLQNEQELVPYNIVVNIAEFYDTSA
jgi:hypothetical protein